MSSRSDSSPKQQSPLQIATPAGSLCYREIAELVAGSEAPPWLPGCLYELAISLALDRHVHNRLSGRADMRKILCAIGDAAALIQRGLGDATVRNFLEDAPLGLGAIPNLGELDRALRNLASRAGKASTSPRLVDEEGNTKAGPGRATTSRSFSSKVYCALLICEVWRHFNGRYPGVRSRKAAQAAEILWHATGGAREGWGTDHLSAWRPYFEAVSALTTADDLRADFQRRLSLQARDSEKAKPPRRRVKGKLIGANLAQFPSLQMIRG